MQAEGMPADPLADLRDITEPEGVWDLEQFLLLGAWILGGVLLLALLIWGIRVWLSRAKEVDDEPRLTALEALRRLAALRLQVGELSAKQVVEEACMLLRECLLGGSGVSLRAATAMELLESGQFAAEAEGFGRWLQGLEPLRFAPEDGSGFDVVPALDQAESLLKAKMEYDKVVCLEGREVFE